MLTHIVWWTFMPEAMGKTAAENTALVREKLEGLRGRIPELKSLVTSGRLLGSCTESADLVLVTRHDTVEDLAVYAAHPEHQQIAAYIKEVVSSRKALDFLE